MDAYEKQIKITEYLDAGNYRAAAIHLRSLTSFLKKNDVTDYSDYWSNLVLLAKIQLYELKDPSAAEATLVEAVDFFRTTAANPTASCLESIDSAAKMLGEIYEHSRRYEEAADTYSFLLSVYEKPGDNQGSTIDTLKKTIERISKSAEPDEDS